jgi:hypothetical protein
MVQHRVGHLVVATVGACIMACYLTHAQVLPIVSISVRSSGYHLTDGLDDVYNCE